MKIVITHPEQGIYLGNALGLGFWTLLDSAGQDAAVTFDSISDARSHIRSWDTNSDPDDYDFAEIAVDGHYASFDKLNAAGLGHLLKDDTYLTIEVFPMIEEANGDARPINSADRQNEVAEFYDVIVSVRKSDTDEPIDDHDDWQEWDNLTREQAIKLTDFLLVRYPDAGFDWLEEPEPEALHIVPTMSDVPASDPRISALKDTLRLAREYMITRIGDQEWTGPDPYDAIAAALGEISPVSTHPGLQWNNRPVFGDKYYEAESIGLRFTIEHIEELGWSMSVDYPGANQFRFRNNPLHDILYRDNELSSFEEAAFAGEKYRETLLSERLNWEMSDSGIFEAVRMHQRFTIDPKPDGTWSLYIDRPGADHFRNMNDPLHRQIHSQRQFCSKETAIQAAETYCSNLAEIEGLSTPKSTSHLMVDAARQDLLTHRDAWRTAMMMAQQSASREHDQDSLSYWLHEINAFDQTFEQMLRLSGSEPVPNDMETHRAAWRNALELAEQLASDEDDRNYWQHELGAFDHTFSALVGSEAGAEAAKDYDPASERDRAEALLDVLLERGMEIRLQDEEEISVPWTTDKAALMENINATDFTRVSARPDPTSKAIDFDLVWGNSASELIADHSDVALAHQIDAQIRNKVWGTKVRENDPTSTEELSRDRVAPNTVDIVYAEEWTRRYNGEGYDERRGVVVHTPDGFFPGEQVSYVGVDPETHEAYSGEHLNYPGESSDYALPTIEEAKQYLDVFLKGDRTALEQALSERENELNKGKPVQLPKTSPGPSI